MYVCHFLYSADDDPPPGICTLSSDLLLQPFDNDVLNGDSFNISKGCELILVKTCKGSAMALEIRVDYFQNNFASTRVYISYEGEKVVMREDTWTIETRQASITKIVDESDANAMQVSILEIQLKVIRSMTDLTVSIGPSSLELSGLCGNLNRELVFPSCTDKIDMVEELPSFTHSYKVKPSERILRPERKDCGEY